MLLHFASVLHFAAIITLCSVTVINAFATLSDPGADSQGEGKSKRAVGRKESPLLFCFVLFCFLLFLFCFVFLPISIFPCPRYFPLGLQGCAFALTRNRGYLRSAETHISKQNTSKKCTDFASLILILIFLLF